MELKAAMDTTGLSQKAIRYYEQQGLIQTSKQENGRKEYDETTIQRLHMIKSLRDLHFTLAQVDQILHQEEARQRLILDKIRACDEQIVELDQIKKQLYQMIENDCVLHEVPIKTPAIHPAHYILITDPNTFFGRMNLVTLILCIGMVGFCFTTDVSPMLSAWVDRALWIYVIVAICFEAYEKKKYEILVKDGYENVQIQMSDIFLQMSYDVLCNIPILWMIKMELVRMLELPELWSRDGAGYLLICIEISLLLVVKAYISYRKYKPFRKEQM